MWSNLLRKTPIATNFYFATEKKSYVKEKKSGSVDSTCHDLDASFFVKLAVIFIWKRLHKHFD